MAFRAADADLAHFLVTPGPQLELLIERMSAVSSGRARLADNAIDIALAWRARGEFVPGAVNEALRRAVSETAAADHSPYAEVLERLGLATGGRRIERTRSEPLPIWLHSRARALGVPLHPE